MNDHEFEKRLTEITQRSIPSEWREEILGQTKTISQSHRSMETGLWNRVYEWFWPHPAAWGALAAIWMILLVLNSMEIPSGENMVATTISESPKLRMAALQEQKRLLKDLMGPDEDSESVPPNFGPRSERTLLQNQG